MMLGKTYDLPPLFGGGSKGWAVGRVFVFWDSISLGLTWNGCLSCNAHSYVTVAFCLTSLASVALSIKWRLITGIPHLPSIVVIKFKDAGFETLSNFI